jgi:hypothetical protein
MSDRTFMLAIIGLAVVCAGVVFVFNGVPR